MPDLNKKGVKLPWLKSSNAAPQSGRKNPNQHFYNSQQWRKTAKQYRQLNPLCEVSKHFKETVAAQMVDHLIPINQGGAKYDPRNLMSMCHKLHNKKSGKEKNKPNLIEYIDTEDGKIPRNKADIFKVFETLKQ